MIMEMKLVPIEKRLKIPQKSGLLKRKNKSGGYSLCHSMLNMKGKTFYGAMLMIHNGKRCIYQGVFKITLWMDGT